MPKDPLRKWSYVTMLERICDAIVAGVVISYVGFKLWQVVIGATIPPNGPNDALSFLFLAVMTAEHDIINIILGWLVLLVLVAIVSAAISMLFKLSSFVRGDRFSSWIDRTRILNLIILLAVGAYVSPSLFVFSKATFLSQNTPEIIAGAQARHDPSYCDQIMGSSTYNAGWYYPCYEAADPEFPRYTQTCDLYTKVDVREGRRIQGECILRKILDAEKSRTNVVDCTKMTAAYAQNNGDTDHVGYIADECQTAALIQKAIINKSSHTCDEFLHFPGVTPYGNEGLPLIKHAACVVHFIGSNEWKIGCHQYGNRLNTSYYDEYIELARCPGADPAKAPNLSVIPKYYFQ